MANKSKKAKKSSAKSSPQRASDENVVRIRANSAPSKKEEVVEAVETKVVASKAPKVDKPAKAVKAKKIKEPGERKSGIRGLGIFRAFGGYFKGAWVELRQVRWPDRRATWGMTAAVLIYSAFFVVLILLLDAAFKYMFELILGK